MRAKQGFLSSVQRRDLVALAVEIGAVALVFGAALGAAQIGAVLIGLVEARGL